MTAGSSFVSFQFYFLSVLCLNQKVRNQMEAVVLGFFFVVCPEFQLDGVCRCGFGGLYLHKAAISPNQSVYFLHTNFQAHVPFVHNNKKKWV